MLIYRHRHAIPKLAGFGFDSDRLWVYDSAPGRDDSYRHRGGAGGSPVDAARHEQLVL